MMSTTVDVLIVGAGPSGSTAATALAQQGIVAQDWKVLLSRAEKFFSLD